MRQATRAQWIKCAIAILLYLVFLLWVRSWWGLIVVPFIFDIYITKKIPWSFWKKSKNPAVRSVMSWVDAIVFALVAVYFVNIYIFQNYQIPSSSLEKSLLVGDFLYVSKMSYGPRVPNTPFLCRWHNIRCLSSILNRISVATMEIQTGTGLRQSEAE